MPAVGTVVQAVLGRDDTRRRRLRDQCGQDDVDLLPPTRRPKSSHDTRIDGFRIPAASPSLRLLTLPFPRKASWCEVAGSMARALMEREGN